MSEDSPSLPPKKTSSHTSRASKMPKQNKNYTHEFDLWNIDDDAVKPIVVEPVTEVVPVDLRLVENPPSTKVSVVTSISEPDKIEETKTINIETSSPPLNQTIQRKKDDSVWDDFLEDDPSNAKTELEIKHEEISQEITSSEPTEEKTQNKTEENKTEENEAPTADTADGLATGETVVRQDTNTTQLQIPKFTKLEKIASLILLTLLVIGGFIAMKLVKDNLKTDHSAIEVPDYPAKGSYAEIKNSDTFWRKPIRTGDNPDAALAEINFIPVVEITLGNCPSPSGAIRVFFRTDKKEQTGDTITKEYKDGKFLMNQSDTLAFACTSGFKEYGDQEAYRASTGNPWYVEVYEAPSLDTDAAGYKLLCRIPISKTRK